MKNNEYDINVPLVVKSKIMLKVKVIEVKKGLMIDCTDEEYSVLQNAYSKAFSDKLTRL